MKERKLIEHIHRILALADTGLLYASTSYDVERNEELKELGLEMLKELTDHPVETLTEYFLPYKDHPTVKVDVRALVLNKESKILFVKEQSDGLWSLPGGWAEIGFSGAESAEKEVKEETGLDVNATQLLAAFDNQKHPHPPQPFHIYKLIYLAEPLHTDLKKGFDILETGFFDIQYLPPLSTNRIVKSQIELIYQRVKDGVKETLFD